MSLALRLLQRALTAVVKTGSLTVVAADGARIEVGDGGQPRVTVCLTDEAALWALLIDPELTLGELFTEGRLVVEQGSIFELLELAMRHRVAFRPSWMVRMLGALRDLARRRHGNDAAHAKDNVHHHYDLDDRLYALFLDPEWQYSCAYFEHPGQSLADAQIAKMRHITAKLALSGGERVLDIGCGWGGLGRYLARHGAGQVLGVTLSEPQLATARDRTAQAGLQDKARFELIDYRRVTGVFDRIVSVGMFEHVGLGDYDAFFAACRDRLDEDGVMLLHTIGSSRPPAVTNPWITKYIFPGGHLPSLSDLAAAVERSGLIITDVEVLRLHYADTLKAWREAFMAHRAQAAALFDERFCRMWEYYLASSEAGFRFGGVVVFQVQLTRRKDAVAPTRDYIAAAETALRG